MIELVKSFSCIVDPEDHVEFNAEGRRLSVDMFTEEFGENRNISVVLSKQDVKDLIKFLQNSVDDLIED